NSWIWTGFSKLAKRIDEMYIDQIRFGIDEPSSQDGAYTQVQTGVFSHDYGIPDMPDLSRAGCLGYGWARNFFNSDEIANQNTLSFWNGAAEIQMGQKLRASSENQFANWKYQCPMKWDLKYLPVTPQLAFYHLTDGNVAPHQQYALINILAGVKFIRRKRWWNL
ncbi:unnamed protein product, partial [marine sediment metagenome]